MQEPVTVLIADDHLHEREGFKRVLSLVKSVTVVGDAATAHEAAQLAIALKPDVVLFDLVWRNFQDRVGIQAIERIKQQAPSTRVLVMTNYPEQHELIDLAWAAGADDVIAKDMLYDGRTLATTIRDVFELPLPQRAIPSLAEALTDREVAVLRLIAQGMTDEEIGLQLSISISTVKRHVSTIIQKLLVSNRTAAVAKAYELGILSRGTIEP